MADKKISALTASTTPLAGTEVLPIVQSGSTVKVAVSDLTAGRAVSAASLALTATPLPVGSGGTGVVTLTANRIPYGNGTSAFSSSGNLVFNSSTNTLEIPFIGVNTGFQTGYYAAVNGNAWFGNGGGVQLGSIENTGGWFDFKGSGNVNGTQISTAISTPVRIVINGAETWRFNTSGNLAPAVAGTGIDFSANTHAAGMTSELLNDYEEGTFTPVLSSSGTAPTVTSYSTQYGSYTKIGNRVLVTVALRATMTSAGTGYPVITGLPYAAAGTCNNGPAWGLATLLNIGINGNFVSGTTVQMISSSYNIVNDYCCFSIMYEI